MLQRSRRTGQYAFYPRAAMAGAAPEDLEWVAASGGGTVYATTTIHPRKRAPYNVAIVELDEGPRLTTAVLGIDPDEVRIGMRVQAHIETAAGPAGGQDAPPRLVFHPAGQDDGRGSAAQ